MTASATGVGSARRLAGLRGPLPVRLLHRRRSCAAVGGAHRQGGVLGHGG